MRFYLLNSEDAYLSVKKTLVAKKLTAGFQFSVDLCSYYIRVLYNSFVLIILSTPTQLCSYHIVYSHPTLLAMLSLGGACSTNIYCMFYC